MTCPESWQQFFRLLWRDFLVRQGDVDALLCVRPLGEKIDYRACNEGTSRVNIGDPVARDPTYSRRCPPNRWIREVLVYDE